MMLSSYEVEIDMFQQIPYWRTRSRLDKVWRRARKQLRGLLADGTAGLPDDEKRGIGKTIGEGCISRAEVLCDANDVITTLYLIPRAGRLGVPIPPDEDEVWRHSTNTKIPVLSSKAIYDLRGAIRNEQNARWQLW
jgi:hypothetical protein